MSSKVRLFILVIASIGCFLPQSRCAADGFPPLGAWAYGSGSGFSNHRGLGGYRTSFYGHSYWPSAGVGYAVARPYARHHGFRSGCFSGYSSYSYYSSYHAIPSYRFAYYPSYSYTQCAYYPPIFAPQFYATPCYTSFSLPVVVPQQVFVPNFLSVQTATPTYTTSLLSSTSPTTSPWKTQASQLISTQGSHSEAIPVELLSAADAIFRAGGYREAATAYARLSVKYGSSDLLLTRRFIAQVASRDLVQAGLVAASAELAGARLDRSSLPDGSLKGLGLDASFVAQTSESLAEQAYRKPNAETLSTLGDWLNLAGDEDRAQVFLAGAAQMARELPTESKNYDSKTELVSLQ